MSAEWICRFCGERNQKEYKKCEKCGKRRSIVAGKKQSTSFFADRREQLRTARSAVEPSGIPLIKELVQGLFQSN